MFQNSALSSGLWEGFSVDSHHQDGDWLHLHLVPLSEQPLICPHCLIPSYRVHDTVCRRIRDRDLFHFKVWLHVPVRRVLCINCGPKVQKIDWLQPGARMTKRLQTYAESFCTLLPIKHVAHLLDLSWHTVKQIDKRRMQREVRQPDWVSIPRLVMDEFALFKGHRYATVVADADTHQVLWIGEGRSRAQIRPFFEQLGKHCQQIKAVAMDMNTAFDLEVQQH